MNFIFWVSIVIPVYQSLLVVSSGGRGVVNLDTLRGEGLLPFQFHDFYVGEERIKL